VTSRLVSNTSGCLAEDSLAQNWKDATTGALADGSADPAEVAGRARNRRGRSTVQIGNAEDIRSAAEGAVIEAGAGIVRSTTTAAAAASATTTASAATTRTAWVAASWDRDGDAREEGDKDSGELHDVDLRMWLLAVC